VLLRDCPDRNQVVPETPAKLALPRKRLLDILFGDQLGTNQKIA
jgi:hypothetical protein